MTTSRKVMPGECLWRSLTLLVSPYGIYHTTPFFQPHKPDKLRVVVDCAALFKGTSLNDQLLHGPDLTNNLFGVLQRFRQESVALVSDIEGMFHQVKVDPQDSDALRFFGGLMMIYVNSQLDTEWSFTFLVAPCRQVVQTLPQEDCSRKISPMR